MNSACVSLVEDFDFATNTFDRHARTLKLWLGGGVILGDRFVIRGPGVHTLWTQHKGGKDGKDKCHYTGLVRGQIFLAFQQVRKDLL